MRLLILFIFFPFCGFSQEDTISEPLQRIDSIVVLYRNLDIEPKFPGGEGEMMRFISENVLYPQGLIEVGHPQSLFQMSFIVEEDGTLTSRKCLNCEELEFENMVLNLLDEMPLWEPGVKDGEKVRSEYFLPVQVCLR